MDYVSLIGGFGALAAAAFLAWRQLRPTEAEPTENKVRAAAASSERVLRPNGQLKIHTAEELLQITGTNGLVEVIRNRLALSEPNWRADAWPVIERYAEFVQLLPASESHHHAQPGGLLIHTLEVASYALTIRQGQKLPAGATPEEQIQLGAAWSFAVLLGALLHDIGKPISDLTVKLYGHDANSSIGLWPALAGPMKRVTGASHYEVDFPPPGERNYSAHQRLSVVLLHSIIPPETMRWLSSDHRLLPALIAYLDDQKSADAEAIAAIIKSADATSVADNLKLGPRTRFSRARQAPLIERIQWGLRALASEGALPINRPGAAMFVDPDGVHLWAVAGVIADKVRTVLNEREVRQEGCAGIPTDNTRLFDTWSEYGALVQPNKDHGKGSVWWVRIEIDEWVQVLTMLKFRLTDVYTAAAVAPKPVKGAITPVSPNTQRNSDALSAGPVTEASGDNHRISDDAATRLDEVGVDTATDADSSQASHSPRHSSGANATAAAPTSASLAPSFVDPDDFINQMLAGYDPPAVAPISPDSHAAVNSEFLNDQDTASAVTNTAPVMRQPVQALTIPKTPPKPKNRAPGAKQRPDADAFFVWVQQGLGTGELSYNESESVVHFTAEGMALISPRIFKMYLEEHSYMSELSAGQLPLNALQNDLQRGGYTSKNGTGNFFTYQVKQSDGSLGAKLTTYVVPNPQAYIRPVPSPNPLLVLMPTEVKTKVKKDKPIGTGTKISTE